MTGYRSPPVEHRFKKGQSGNPAGRPRGSKRKPPRRTPFFDEMITCKLNGKKLRISRGERLVRIAAIFAHQKNDLGLQRLLIRLKEISDQAQADLDREERSIIIGSLPAPKGHISCIEDAADVIGFGKKSYLQRATARVLLESWVIEEALIRLGEHRLTREEQEAVLAAARFPERINWPDYWEADLRQRGKGWRAPKAPAPPREKPRDDQIWMSVGEHLRWQYEHTPQTEMYVDEEGEWQERQYYPHTRLGRDGE